MANTTKKPTYLGKPQVLSKQTKASGSAIQEALGKQQSTRTSTGSSVLGSLAQTTTRTQGKTGAGLGAILSGVQDTGWSKVPEKAKPTSTTSTGSKTTGTGGYVATPSKPVNPYDKTGGTGPENPYAKILAGIGGQGGNPYASLTGQGGTNPYLEMMQRAGQYKGTIPEAEAEREGLYGVSEATKRQMDQYGGEWTPGASTQEAQERYRQMQGQAPGEYSDPYAEQLSKLYEQITGRPGFQYDLDGDMLYQQYAQQYQQMGRQAMQDAMGQAAAMTGGYGSSYASAAGNQAYQGYLQQLNDKIPELYDRALATYQMEGDQMKDQYSMLRDLQDTDYSRYRDELSRYYEDLGLAREDWQQERAFDYGKYGDSQDYWTRMAQLESQDARTSQQYDLQRAQMLTDESRDQRDYLTKLQQLASDEDWKQREYDLSALDRQTAWDQWQKEFEQGTLDRQTAWDQSQQERQYELMMQMLQLGADPSDVVKAGSGLSPYDIYELQQKLKPQTGTYYGGTGSSTGSGAKSTGTTPTATPTTTKKPTGQTGTQGSVGTEPEDLYMAGLISAQQLYEMQMRRAYGK